jgi:hypothetical protein
LATARHSSDTEDTQKTSTPVLAAGLNDVGKKVVSLNDCKAETELEPAAALSWDLEQVIGPQNFTEINTNVWFVMLSMLSPTQAIITGFTELEVYIGGRCTHVTRATCH